MFQGKTCVILTGASKGFGRAVACSFAKEFAESEFGKDSVLVLVARSKEGLDETRRAVEKIYGDLHVHVISGDLGDVNHLDDLTASIFRNVDSKQFTSAVLINNAASLGDKITSITNHTDVNSIRKYMDFNITSFCYFTTHFLNHFSTTKNYVINISSICAIKPTPSMAYYCAGKAARNMFNQVLSYESKDTRVLNYAPGPMKTDMFEDVLQTDHDELKEMFVQMKEQDKVLEPETSADKLVLMLKQDRYKSGDHIDYFDEMP
ncbi:sepiapterin reductase-like [Dendronephthya gigantea]|uniref:sepiapterin reductase-like n=1 Tax=Dendronephthya gigantea TaxID=151771 RepID=UPI001069A871|nr:sepiapterin reductase-like [Dendronephthya gigantea]